MRLKLKEGKQKELILNYKHLNNLTWDNFANLLRVKKHVLIDLKYEKNLISHDLFNYLNFSGNYQRFIQETKKDNWGQSKGGIISKGNTKNITIPSKNKELAELVGIVLGDGSLGYYKGYKRSIYRLNIAGDSRYDREYLLFFVKPLIERLFDIFVSIHYCKKSNSMWIYSNGRKLIEFFENVGLKSGNKIVNNVGIPEWIKRDKKFLKVCLRGLIDTDGCIARMSNKDPKLLRLNFTNNCIQLFKDTKCTFEELGYSPHPVNNKIFLSKQNDVKRYVREIGFNNKKHINRLKMFKPNTALWCSERV